LQSALPSLFVQIEAEMNVNPYGIAVALLQVDLDVRVVDARTYMPDRIYSNSVLHLPNELLMEELASDMEDNLDNNSSSTLAKNDEAYCSLLLEQRQN
jgi:hypothetical protein